MLFVSYFTRYFKLLQLKTDSCKSFSLFCNFQMKCFHWLWGYVDLCFWTKQISMIMNHCLETFIHFNCNWFSLLSLVERWINKNGSCDIKQSTLVSGLLTLIQVDRIYFDYMLVQPHPVRNKLGSYYSKKIKINKYALNKRRFQLLYTLYYLVSCLIYSFLQL